VHQDVLAYNKHNQLLNIFKEDTPEGEYFKTPIVSSSACGLQLYYSTHHNIESSDLGKRNKWSL